MNQSSENNSCVRSRLIAVTGGIGSGKSVVSSMLRCMGFAVYDCDSEARRLMDCSDEIKRLIASDICSEAVRPDGSIDRAALAEAVFADALLLRRLNDAVHETVRRDLHRWCSGRRLAFVETAILYQSSLDLMVDEVWDVVAPADIRIRRVMARNGLTQARVEQRIASQDSFVSPRRHQCVRRLINDGDIPLLPQVLALLSKSLFNNKC